MSMLYAPLSSEVGCEKSNYASIRRACDKSGARQIKKTALCTETHVPFQENSRESLMTESGFLTFKGSTITKGQVIDLVVLDCSKLWRIWTPENQEKGAVLAVTKRALDTRVP